jgi:hypothetical protein
MKMFSMIAAVLSLGLGTAAFAQDVPDTPKPALQEVTGPAHLGGEAPALAIASDIESRNVLVAGFSLGAAYDTRGLYNSTTNSYSGDARYFVQPSVAFQRTFSTGNWTLSYTPGFSYSQDDTNNSQYTQNLAGDVSWKPTSRLQVHIRQDFSLTDNPFETVGRVDLLPGLGGPLGPNYDGVLPNTKRTSIVSNLDLAYRLGEHTAIGMTGGFQKYTYDATTSSATGFPYVNSEVFSGSAFLSHQFSSVLTTGVQLAYTDIYSTGEQVARTQATAPMLFVKLNPSLHTEITVFAGPEYARTREMVPGFVGPIIVTAPVYEYHWYPTFGGTVTWNGDRTAFDVQGQRRIANGGGVMAAVQSTSAGAAYRVRVSRKVLVQLRTNWSDEKGIGIIAGGSRFQSLWAGGGPVFELNRMFSLRGDVAYVHQSETNLAPVAGNHLLLQGSLEYRFHKSLGD